MFPYVNTLKGKHIKVNTLKLAKNGFPPQLAAIPDPPKQLHYLGDHRLLMDVPKLAVVGSRKVTPYGKAVTTQLARAAAEQGIVIVSGLALGVDALAHQAALDAGGKTIAVLPAGLDKICPATNRQLAENILRQGGTLVTEHPFNTEVYKTSFLVRNRIISGLSDGVLIPEATTRSGSLNTARNALEQGRTVMAVPGAITSDLSAGPNSLIKMGATPITELADILDALNIGAAVQRALPIAANPEEAAILDHIIAGISDGAELLAKSRLSAVIFNQTLTMLEITGKIRPLGAGHWSIA